MSVKLLTEHHLEFLSLKGGCSGSSESTLVKTPHCWKSHVAAQLRFLMDIIITYLVNVYLGQKLVSNKIRSYLSGHKIGKFFFSSPEPSR